MRLIDADAFIRFLAEQKVKETGAFTTGVNKALNIAISALKNPQITPTVDAVPEHFCSYGERKAKMTRKRFVKLLMAGGVSRNEANFVVKIWASKDQPYATLLARVW